MTDLIARARKEWCARSFQMTKFSGEKYVETDAARAPCPEEVVAALLDVLDTARQGIDPYGNYSRSGQAAEAAIAKALEGQ